MKELKKLKNNRTNGFIFNQMTKLPTKIYSNLSNLKLFLSKTSNTIMHRKFFEIISQNPEYVKNHCIDLKNPFHFGCWRWIINQ